MSLKFSYYRQKGRFDCGLACLRMLSKYYGVTFNYDIRKIPSQPLTLNYLKQQAELIGFIAYGVKITQNELFSLLIEQPMILHWHYNHYIIAYGYTSNPLSLLIADPAPLKGLRTIGIGELQRNWSLNESTDINIGYALLLNKTS